MNTIELYTQLIKANALAYDSPIDEHIINNFFRLASSKSETETSDLELFYDGIASAIYNIAEKLRGNIDQLKRLSDSPVHGISRSEKANIMLLGETSAGKTSFLERIYGEDCGKTGAIPITAFPVVHKITEAPSSLQVKFYSQFSIDPKQKVDFDKLLDKYDFREGFEIQDTNYKTINEDYKLESRDEFINFIREANSFPSCFEEIVWSHKKSYKQIGATEFANFIDMPGTGGQDEHTKNIKSYFYKKGENVDIILYLIKSDQGIPSSYRYMKDLKDEIEKAKVDAKIYFVYQIDNNDSFDEKTTALKKFINVDGVDAIDGFSESDILFYTNAIIVDSRGKQKDRKKANIALASVVKDFFVERCLAFHNSLKAVNKPKEDSLLRAPKPNDRKINGLLYNFLEHVATSCHSGNLPGIEEVKKRFKWSFFLDTDIENENFDKDLKCTLNAFLWHINGGIDSLFDFLSTDSPWYDWKEVTRTFDPTKYNMKFYDTYYNDTNYEDWQKLIYYIQAYHWLRLTYNDNSFEKIYAQKIADPLKGVLYDNIKRLESIDTSFICKNIKDKEEY